MHAHRGFRGHERPRDPGGAAQVNPLVQSLGRAVLFELSLVFLNEARIVLWGLRLFLVLVEVQVKTLKREIHFQVVLPNMDLVLILTHKQSVQTQVLVFAFGSELF